MATGKRKKNAGKRRVWSTLLKVVLVIIVFAVAGVSVIAANTLNQVKRYENTKFSDVDLTGFDARSDDKFINILLIGDDYRKEKNYSGDGLTDVMIIATIDKEHKTLKMTSLMRDTLVDVTGADKLQKLNSAKPVGGVTNLYKTIAKNFNIKLDGYVMVGFNSFKKLVNAVGGIEIEITDSEARYLNCTNYIRKKKNRNLKAGMQHLNGDQALGYCRIRKGMDKIGEEVATPNGLTADFGRTWRQRTVLSAVIQKMKKLPPSEWIETANKVLSGVETDLDNKTILSCMSQLLFLGTTEVHQLQIPVKGYYRDSLVGEYAAGACLVATNGVDSDFDISVNSEILRTFIFEYDGEDEFTYPLEKKTE